MSAKDPILLADRYLVADRLAAAKTGLLMGGKQELTGIPCVVKVYRTREETDRYLEIEEEIALLRSFKESGNLFFVNILDLLEEGGRWFAAFEKIEGIALFDLVFTHPTFLGTEEIIRYFGQVVDQCQAMKRGKGHLPVMNLGPQNLIVTPTTIRLVDFDLELLYGQSRRTEPARRRFLSEDDLLHELGKLLYFLATKKLAIDPLARLPDPKSLNPLLEEELLKILKRALDPRPTHRYSSVEELHQALQSLGSMLQLKKSTTPSPQPLVPEAPLENFTSRRKTAFLAIGLALALLLAFTWLWRSRERGSPSPLPLRRLILAATSLGLEWIDPENGNTVHLFPVPGEVTGLVPWPSSGKVIVLDQSSQTILVQDPYAPEKASLLMADVTLTAYAFDPVLHLFFGAVAGQARIDEASAVTPGNTVPIPLPNPAKQLVVEPYSHRLYVTSEGDRELRVVDILSHRVVTSIRFGEIPELLGAERNRLVVYLKQAKSLELYAPSGRRLNYLPVALSLPAQAAFLKSTKEGVIWSEEPKLLFFNPELGTISREVSLPFVPKRPVADLETERLYATDDQGKIYVIPLSRAGTPQALASPDKVSALALWKP